MTHPQDVSPATGDWLSTNAGGATHYSFFVEVPPATTNLVVEIFDPDVNQGPNEGSASALPHYDQPRSGGASGANYLLVNPAGTTAQTINGTAALPAASHAQWFAFTTVASPTNGHWEVRVDSQTGGSVGNGYGIRARATVNSVSNTQLRVYADAHISVQNYGATGVYAAHPYVTGYCQVRVRDHDADASGGGIGAASSITLTSSLPSAVTTTINGPTMSDQNWATNTTSAGWHTDVAVIRPGIYTTEIRPRSTGTTNEFQVGFFNPNAPTGATVPTVPALGASWANSWRTYLPRPDGTVDGAAPVKPYLTQRLFHAADGSPNPPTTGQTGNYDVVIQMVNPTAYPIVFSASNLVTSFIPGSQALRAASPIVVSQGSVVASPSAGGSGLVSWNPGTVAAGQTVTITYRVAVAPTAAGRIIVTGTPASNGTTAQYLDETANSTQPRATYTWGPLCELAVSTTVAVSTPATLAGVSSRREGNRVVVDLTTAVQVGVAFYELLDMPSGARSWKPVAGSETPAPLDHLEAKSLRLEGLTSADRFMIRTVDIDGSTMLHGPFDVGASIGGEPASREIPWTQIRAELNAFERSALARNSEPETFDLRVEKAGIARLRFEDLPAGGWNGTAVNSIGVYDQGSVVPIKLSSNDALFGPGDSIEFIADAANNLYSKARVYQLKRNQLAPARISQTRAVTSIAGMAALTVEREVAIDADAVYNFSSPVPDPWHVERLVSTPTAPLARSYSLQLDASQVGDVQLTGTVIGGIDRPDHEVRVSINGTLVETLRFGGLRLANFDTLVPASLLNAGVNTLNLTMPVASGTDIVWLERLGLRYMGKIAVQNGSASATPLPGDYSNVPVADQLFSAGFDNAPSIDSCIAVNAQNFCQAAVVAGLESSSTRIYRRQLDGSVVDLVGAAVTPNGVAWAEPRTLGREIFAADSTGLVSVSASVAEQPAALLGSAELLIIAHPMFMDAVETLANRRRAQGLTVQTVSSAAAYARYSSGNIDPEAIDQLVADAVAKNSTRYVLLVGADSYDYQNRLGIGSISFIPSHYVYLHPVVNHAPTDGNYADVDGDQIADVAIGRLPVRTIAELAAVIQKIEAYEARGTAASAALFIADDTDPNGAPFRQQSELLRTQFSSPSNTAYLDDLPPAQVRQSLIAAAGSGASLIHYLGHSSPSTWSFPAPGLITPAELFAGVLENAARPTVVVQWGCWNSYLAAPRTDSMGHAWLLAPGAAVAVVGATSLTEAEHDASLGYRLLNRWNTTGARIGDAILQAKRDMALSDPGAVDVLLGTTLFGDPTLRRRP